jgi:hypothetical protein
MEDARALIFKVPIPIRIERNRFALDADLIELPLRQRLKLAPDP